MAIERPREKPSSPIRPENYRVHRVLKSIIWLGVIAHGGFIPLFYWLEIPILAAFNIVSVLMWAGAAALNNRGVHGIAIALITVEVVLHACLATWFFGWDAGFQTYLMPMLAFTTINTRQRRTSMLVESSFLVLLYIGLYVLVRDVPTPLSEVAVETAFYVNVIVVFSAIGIITYFFRAASMDAEQAMELAASTDMLTMLVNRRRMRELLEHEWSRSDRSGSTFGILMLDIDHFKRFNDSYGHACGDYVLSSVAAQLKSNLRDHDIASRWGGEEFLVLLPDTELAQAEATAERIRDSFESSTVEYEGRRLEVTMTVGVAVCSRAESIEGCVNRADEALYIGKHHGRNRVVTSETPLLAEVSGEATEPDSVKSEIATPPSELR